MRVTAWNKSFRLVKQVGVRLVLEWDGLRYAVWAKYDFITGLAELIYTHWDLYI